MSTTSRTKVTLLLAAGPAVGELRERLAGERELLAERVPQGAVAIAGIGVDDRAPKAALTAEERDGYDQAGYAGALSVAGRAGLADELTAALEGAAARLGDAIDARASVAVAGTEETFIAGDGPLGGLFAVRRPADRTLQQMHDFWRLEHTKLSMLIPDFVYRQFHGVDYASERAAAVAGVGGHDVDGIVEWFFDSLAWQARLAELPLMTELYVDERNFIDHERSPISYVEYL
ncbi:EthD domain-containing protein [Conexibacter sp. CPCC 206217]|uniref:EthD domain-containing protein n=1 Tax=Conexibacter sp. CPCC 206217 TaxID=3064574 RepID=UPI002728B352|nr:EthD domain-containing protein [Conexibacter sp. CPCC 206217]MDO8212239.1 EthD domain-containing protein [Conexibacter sp. CPCC 206217]